MSGRVPRSHSVPKGHWHEGSARLSAKRTHSRESLSAYRHAALYACVPLRDTRISFGDATRTRSVPRRDSVSALRLRDTLVCMPAARFALTAIRLFSRPLWRDRPLITLPKGIKIIVFGLIHPNLKLVYPFR